MSKPVEVFKDQEYRILLTKSEDYSMSFDIIESTTCVLHGYVKWDGCSNWKTPDGFYGIHLCGGKTTRFEELRRRIEICYDYTKSHLATYYL